MKKRIITFAVSVGIVFLTSCSAPRGLNHSITKATAPELEPISVENSELATRLAESGGEFLLLNLSGSQFEARVGESYRSALGEDCKRVYLKGLSGLSGTGAVCKDGQGLWRYLSPLN